MGRLDGRVALISGVARGQGRSHAVKLAQEGADIIGFDICEQIDSVEYPMATAHDLEETTNLVEKTGRRMIAGKVDVRNFDAVERIVDEGVLEFGRLDIVLANAGIMPTTGEMRHHHQSFRDAIDVMLTGVFNTVTAAKRHLLACAPGGSIVITSSTAGLKGLGDGEPGVLGYSAAKHGVVGLMRCWANDLGPMGIRVNTVHPTGVNSPMVVNEAMAGWVAEVPQLSVTLQNLLPVQRIECDDVSNAILFLCSDDGRYMTGQTVAIDAGFTVR